MFSSLSNEEYFNLRGTLPADRIEELLNDNSNKVDLEDIPFDAILGQLPAEDFTASVEERLHALSKKLRGDNKQEILAIIAELSDMAQCQFYAADHAREIVSDFVDQRRS